MVRPVPKKVEGEDITAPVPSTRAQVIGLMEALKESLGAEEGEGSATRSGTDG